MKWIRLVLLFAMSSAAFGQITDLADLCASTNNTTMDVLAKGAAECVKLAFVSTTLFNGNLGGVTGANAKCQVLANEGGLPGRYVAWISTSTSEMDDGAPVFRQAVIPYWQPQFDAGNVQIASNYSSLVSGSISAFRVSELGVRLDLLGGYTDQTWTGTNSDGTVSSNTCSDWTSSSSGASGDYGEGDQPSWSNAGTASCDNTYHLYCFQQ